MLYTLTSLIGELAGGAGATLEKTLLAQAAEAGVTIDGIIALKAATAQESLLDPYGTYLIANPTAQGEFLLAA